MAKNPLFELREYGQSIWFDTLSRRLIASGGLQRLVDEYAVVGVTSNPTIFQKALEGSTEYDEEIRELVAAGHAAPEMFESLATGDVRMACDLLRPVYEQTRQVDGRVSIEVGPEVAFDTEGTMEQARRLWRRVGRPNLMIKIPATPEGLPAIEQMTAEGLSINITLLFSVAMYERVMEAYLRGLERRVAHDLPVEQIHSVASFFVSRVDTRVDQELEHRLRATESAEERARLRGLQGRAAIANAKLAYQAFKRVFQGARWEALAEKGAHLQRPLWASTSVKNPAYPDTRYVEELIGPHTVNTVPENTLLAFADHGEVRGATIEEGVEEARETVCELAGAGIDLHDITERWLIEEGIRLFARSMETLLEELETKRARFARAMP